MPRLTKRTLDAIKPDPEKEIFAWCSATPGFGARVYPSGRAVFIVQTRVGRAQRRVKIGAYGPFTVEQAREKAEELLRDAASGVDPQRAKRERKAALTVAELCDIYLEAAQSGRVLTRFGRPKTASTIATDIGRIERHIKPLIGTMVARDVRPADVQRMADQIAEGRTAITAPSGKKRGKIVVKGGALAAARVVELLGGIWTWASRREHVPAVSLTRGVDKAKADPRKRVLSGDELKALGVALNQAPSQVRQAVDAVRLIALTGMRREEAVKLKWAEIDFHGSCLQLTTTKTGHSTRPLGSAALEQLRAMKVRAHSDFVFPASRGDGPADLKKRIAALFTAARLADVRSHDLRRSFATIGDELGLSEATIGEILGHSSRTVTGRHYIRRPDAALISAATRIADRVDRALAGRSADVSQLRGAGE